MPTIPMPPPITWSMPRNTRRASTRLAIKGQSAIATARVACPNVATKLAATTRLEGTVITASTLTEPADRATLTWSLVMLGPHPSAICRSLVLTKAFFLVRLLYSASQSTTVIVNETTTGINA